MTILEASLALRPDVAEDLSPTASAGLQRPVHGTLAERLRRLRRRRTVSRLASLGTVVGWVVGAGALLSIAGGAFALGR